MKNFNKKYISPLFISGLLVAAGCSNTPGSTTVAGEFPALVIDTENETVTRTTENVTLVPNFDEDENITSVDVTVFGETVTFTRDDVLDANNRISLAFGNGSTIIIEGAFDSLLDVAEAINDQEPEGFVQFEQHISGFIFRLDGEVLPNEQIVMEQDGDDGDATFVAAAVNEDGWDDDGRGGPIIDLENTEAITNATTFVAGNETDPEDLGSFAFDQQDGDEGPVTATYFGEAVLIDGEQGPIEGNAKIQVDFTNQQVGGYISRLREGSILEEENRFVKKGFDPGFYSDQQIRINQTTIDGNGFQTTLDVVNGGQLGSEAANLLDGTLQDPDGVDGFFTDSQVNGTFFGPGGGEIGGTIGYTRTQDFELAGDNGLGAPTVNALNDGGAQNGGIEVPQSEPTGPVEGIGVFSVESDQY